MQTLESSKAEEVKKIDLLRLDFPKENTELTLLKLQELFVFLLLIIGDPLRKMGEVNYASN